MGIFQYECITLAATPPQNVGCERCLSITSRGGGGWIHNFLYIISGVFNPRVTPGTNPFHHRFWPSQNTSLQIWAIICDTDFWEHRFWRWQNWLSRNWIDLCDVTDHNQFLYSPGVLGLGNGRQDYYKQWNLDIREDTVKPVIRGTSWYSTSMILSGVLRSS